MKAEVANGSRLWGLSGVLLGLAACASVQPASRPIYLFQGRYEHLEQLVAAARACGYPDVQMSIISPHATPAVLIDRPVRPEPRFDCLAHWIRQHPETGFGSGL
jgi:hypothetical protein